MTPHPFPYPIVCLATPVEDPTRFASAQAHFAERGVGPVRYAYGLHKETSGLETAHLYMVDRGPSDPANPANDYRMGPHPTNIWVGHYMIWNALRLSGDHAWLVLECDARFPEDWYERVRAAYRYVPGDWDLLYIGSCCTGGRKRVYDQLHVVGSYGSGLVTAIREQSIVQFAGTSPQCNHAYLVTAAAAEILCTTLRKVWAPIDIQQASECWGHTLPQAIPMVAPPTRPLNVYTVLPRIVGQADTEIPT